jgi:hypothetical protein
MAEQRRPALEQQLPGVMIAGRCMHRADHAKVVSAPAEGRQKVGELHAAAAMPCELSRATETAGVALDDRIDQGPQERRRHRFAMQPIQLGLRIKQI